MVIHTHQILSLNKTTKPAFKNDLPILARSNADPAMASRMSSSPYGRCYEHERSF